MLHLYLIVLFSVLQHTSSTDPIPREHGWWSARSIQLQKIVDTRGNKAKVIFVGDSITQGWESNGSKIWEDKFAPLGAINLGISGDRTEHVIWRLQNGHLNGLAPEIAVVMIGTNNFGQQQPDSESEVLQGVVGVVDVLKSSLPDTQILLCDIFPRGATYNAMRGSILQVNQALQATYVNDAQVSFYQVGQLFIEEDGSIDTKIMPDFLHLSEEGYRRWANAILYKVYMSNEPMPYRKGQLGYIDLADDIARQVTIDKEEGQYLGHPTTVLLQDGKTILCIYPKGHGKGQLVMKKSNDGGKTWSGRLPVPASWSTSKETPHIYQVTDALGVCRLILFSSLYPIRMSVSEDDGSTWSELSKIGEYGGIVGMADLIETGSGNYTAFFHDDGRFIYNSGKSDGLFYVYAVDSNDGGMTWSEPRIVAHDPNVHLCEPGLIASPDKKRFAMLLRENSRTQNSHISFSDDNGKTWSSPVEMLEELTGDRHQAVYDAEGRLLITFRDTCSTSDTAGDWVAWVGKFEDLEKGRSGDYRIRLSDNKYSWDCAYPGVQCLPDGTIFAATYGHWNESEEPFIRGVHLNLSDLEEEYAIRGD